MVEQRSPKPRVVGSSPATPAIFYAIIMLMLKMPRRVRKFELFLKVVTCCLLIFNSAVLLLAFITNTDFYNRITMPFLPEDDIPPVVTLRGQTETRVPIGSKYEDPGVEAYDLRSEVSITTEGNVDAATEGDYVIKYTACDERNNCSSLERKVKVLNPAGTIYLTFDDGPSEFTNVLLDVLKKYHVVATFFVTGRGSDDTLKREFDEGHSIGLHSFTHNYSVIYRSTDAFWGDITRVGDRVKSITGLETKLMRFPGGSSNTISARYDGGVHIMSKLVQEASERGYVYFDWNVLSGDAGETTETDKVFENVTGALKRDGVSIVLQHDTKDFSINAVERIIQYGLENDYIFDKLSLDSFNAHHNVNN